MIRFIDLSQDYWTDPEENGGKLCAFLDTYDDRFLLTTCNSHVFECLLDVEEHPMHERLEFLLPEKFFNES